MGSPSEKKRRMDEDADDQNTNKAIVVLHTPATYLYHFFYEVCQLIANTNELFFVVKWVSEQQITLSLLYLNVYIEMLELPV
jgi:hypothetical protein